jgi:hypothetical protein
MDSEDASAKRSSVQVPKWAIGIVAGAASMVGTAVLAWAVNIDGTQRGLIEDVSSLKEHRLHVTEQLDRIETKLDKLLSNR